MKAITLSTPTQEWTPASYRFGEDSTYNGAPLTHEIVLSDRRSEGGGIAFLLKFTPPAKKLIKLVATARSDEHVYILDGGYCDKVGKQRRFPGDYALNPKDHNHAAFIGRETVALVVYSGEPDEVHEFAVINPEPAS
jgi:hypothetical protein